MSNITLRTKLSISNYYNADNASAVEENGIEQEKSTEKSAENATPFSAISACIEKVFS